MRFTRSKTLALATLGIAFLFPSFPAQAQTHDTTPVLATAKQLPVNPFAEFPVPEAEPAPPASAVDDIAHALGGDLTLETWLLASESYRIRSVFQGSQTGSDQDVRLLIDGGAQTLSGDFSLSTSGAFYWDVDGGDKTGGLYSLRDSTNGLQLDLYTLEARYEARTLRRLSVGRLAIDNGWPMILDGFAAEISPSALIPRSSAFGLGQSALHIAAGRTVHFYENDPNAFEDWILSSALELRFLDMAKLLIDYALLVEDTAAHQADHSYGATLFLRGGQWANTRFYVRGINQSLARLGAQGTFTIPGARVGSDVAMHAQTTTLNELSESLDPFFTVLGKSNPSMRGTLRLWARQDFGFADAGLAAGLAGRVALFGEDEAFNRTYGHLFVTADFQDLLVKGLYTSVSLEDHVASRLLNEGLLAAGGELGFSRQWFRVRAGTGYQRFKYSYFRQLEEIADVRSVYASSSVRLFDNLRFSARYQLELTDRIVHTLSLTVGQNMGVSL